MVSHCAVHASEEQHPNRHASLRLGAFILSGMMAQLEKAKVQAADPNVRVMGIILGEDLEN